LGTQRRYTFGGLSDRAFAAIELLDRGEDLDWSTLFDRSVEPPSAKSDDADGDADGPDA